jgi:hypothetical protein
MEICCENNYSVCEPLAACAEFFYVKVPIGWADPTIKVRIRKANRVRVVSALTIVDGWIAIPLTNYPPSFFNAYAGTFQLQFFNADQPEYAVEFTAMDGQTYTSILFSFAATITEETATFLNVFNSTIPVI